MSLKVKSQYTFEFIDGSTFEEVTISTAFYEALKAHFNTPVVTGGKAWSDSELKELVRDIQGQSETTTPLPPQQAPNPYQSQPYPREPWKAYVSRCW